jgi:malonyl-CoA O-methyltransferase
MDLRSEYLPATGGSRQQLVLLHGWGGNREIWRPLLALVRPWADVTLLDLPGCAPRAHDVDPDLDELLDAVLAVAPPQAVYVGWSLGGQIAVEIASRWPDRTLAVVTVCSNPRFVAGDGWPGMAADTFAEFRDGYLDQPEGTLRRFDSLQVDGAELPRPLLRRLRAMREDVRFDRLGAGLAWLASLDQRDRLRDLEPPRLHLFAAEDGLVPVACAARVAEQSDDVAGAEVIVIDHSSHLLPLEQPAELAAQLRDFLRRQGRWAQQSDRESPLDKGDVAESFSRAARDYDSVAALQRDVGTRLLDSLEELDYAPARILDLGCGTGYFLPELTRRFPGTEYLGLDLARGMVEYARQRFGRAERWIVGDAEALPLAADSVDLVFSSLAIQWCYRPELLFAELARVLRPGGRCVFTTLGPGTLKELRAAWAAVDEHQHVNTFTPGEELMEAAERLSGLSLRLSCTEFAMHYPRVRDLLAELKTLGAHNVNRQRPHGLTGRRVLQGMMDAYEAWRVGGLLPATYDVLFGVLEKR